MSESNFIYSRDTRDQFKAIVLKHLTEHVSDDAWFELRDYAKVGPRVIGPGAVYEELTREQLVKTGMSEAGLGLGDVLTPKFRDSAEVIGEIEGAPVYYVVGTGIYVWGQPQKGFVLELWITQPAYPPGW
jgi:hypothetical protein